MPGSFIRSLVQRGSGLAFSAIKPNKTPYFLPTAARSGQGYRFPFARIPIGILPRLSDIRALADAEKAADTAKIDNEAAWSNPSESTSLRNGEKVLDPIMQADSMEAQDNLEKQERGSLSENPSLDVDSNRRQPDPLTSEVSHGNEAETQSSAAKRIILPVESNPIDLPGVKEVVSEGPSVSNLQINRFESATLEPQISPDMRDELGRGELGRKSEMTKSAQEATSTVDSISSGPQIDQIDHGPSFAMRNEADVVSDMPVNNMATLSETDSAMPATPSGIRATAYSSPEPKLKFTIPEEILVRSAPNSEPESASSTHPEPKLTSSILTGARGSRFLSPEPKMKLVMPGEIKISTQSNPETKSASLAQQKIEPIKHPSPENKLASSTPAEVKATSLADTSPESASSTQYEIAPKSFLSPEPKMKSAIPGEIKISTQSNPETKSASLAQQEIEATRLSSIGPKLASPIPAENKATAYSSPEPKLASLAKQENANAQFSNAPLSNLEPAFEQSYASSARYHPGIRQERDFGPAARPEVHITIGTIEVRADSKPDTQPVELPSVNPGSFGFDEYAQIRRYLSWER